MITWRKDGEQLSHAADRRVNISSTVRAHLPQTHLVVKRIGTNDCGEYTCGAVDDSGHHFTDFVNITIKSKLHGGRLLGLLFPHLSKLRVLGHRQK